MIALGLLLACGAPSAPAPAPVPAAPEASAPAPEPVVDAQASRGVRVLHHRQGKGRTPAHVSATWVDDGLQLMVTGFQAPCSQAPGFSMVLVADTLRLVEQAAPPADDGCTAPHTLMLQIDGLGARDLEVEIVREGGEAFGATSVRSTDH